MRDYFEIINETQEYLEEGIRDYIPRNKKDWKNLAAGMGIGALSLGIPTSAIVGGLGLAAQNDFPITDSIEFLQKSHPDFLQHMEDLYHHGNTPLKFVKTDLSRFPKEYHQTVLDRDREANERVRRIAEYREKNPENSEIAFKYVRPEGSTNVVSQLINGPVKNYQGAARELSPEFNPKITLMQALNRLGRTKL